ncbi:tRNA modification GTPase mss1 mitochondrial precursor [Dothidotthia symphoricarpi CBS 119687]|uniref:tRNA modification GTPase mss1 mitochondrial n=1 Tax=Dothidotthia symphoricarpi CBS 119687 TaxID=1392245 RepID=A0A6A6AD75_9PLEO|nr:tRNA modification GTPase mss1 mitochondrial precursor [Dothidotthia symphoricarpi CBS 119687]KAF2128878.1 tRNA modification GTPase mss1 mitochondrial precursor [Dothidotthia symphoricarpi CBS 119687]
MRAFLAPTSKSCRLVQGRFVSVHSRYAGFSTRLAHSSFPRGIHCRVQQPLKSPQYRLYHSSSLSYEEPTIYALSTASGKAAIAVIRISGPACRQPRYATLRRLYSPHIPPSPATLLDSGALVLHFPAPNTVTGEDVLELHVHGGPAIVRAVLAAVSQCTAPTGSEGSNTTHQIRYAEPGEFTRRAFANNRMDLPQIESLGETLSASTEQQRKLSVRGTTSSLATRYELWRMLLLQARGELEALIDFSEDQHFDESPAVLCASVAEQIRNLRVQIEAHVANAVRGELLRNGISVALLGAPNAGKSSLLNRIVGRDAAIVSQEAGTTRDVVEVGVDLAGWLVKIGDMAGLRKAGLVGAEVVGAVEQEGIRRAKQRALESDVLIIVQDATSDMDPEVMDTAKQCVDLGINVVVAINKIDRLESSDGSRDAWKEKMQSTLGIAMDRVSFISCRDAATSAADIQMKDPGHIQSFLDNLLETFKGMTAALVPDSEPDPSIWQESLGATERQRVLLSECLDHLESFLAVAGSHPIDANQGQSLSNDGLSDTPSGDEDAEDIDIVVAAESLRSAAEALARITGRGDSGDVEEVLGVVFEK